VSVKVFVMQHKAARGRKLAFVCQPIRARPSGQPLADVCARGAVRAKSWPGHAQFRVFEMR
jgi:hypothetical protein